MERRVILLGLAAAFSMAAGCLPEERIVWSPNGELAAVRTTTGFYFCDSSGKLSPKLADEVQAVAWLNDSKHIVVAKNEPLAHWRDVAELLPPPRQAEIARQAMDLRKEILAYEGDWKNFEPQSVSPDSMADLPLMLMYLRDNNPDGLPAKVGKEWEKIRKMTADSLELVVVKASVSEDPNAGLITVGKPLARRLEKAVACRISPDDKAVAFVTARSGSQISLNVVPTDGLAEAVVVARNVAWYPDWAGNQHLVFVQGDDFKTDASPRHVFGAVMRQMVRNSDGQILAVPEKPKRFAYVPFIDVFRVQALSNGAICFTSTCRELPTTESGYNGTAEYALFMLQPGLHDTMTLKEMFSEEDFKQLSEEPTLAVPFQLSPDEKQVAISTFKGGAAVCDLSGHDVTVVQKDWPKGTYPLMVPTWRKAGQLCFMVPAGSPHGSKVRPEVVLYTIGVPEEKAWKMLSKDWPDEIIKGLWGRYPHSEPKSGPASGERFTRW